MAGVTSTVVALAGAGLSAAQAVGAKKKAQEARRAAKTAMDQASSIKEVNKMAALQSPDVSSLAFQQNAAGTQQAVAGLQEMGPEGAASVASVAEANRRANLEAAQVQAQQDAARDQIVLGTEQDIEAGRAEREMSLAKAEITGAQQAAAFQEGLAAESMTSAFSSLSSAIGSAGDSIFKDGRYIGGKMIANESDLSGEQMALWMDAKNSGSSWSDFLKTLK